MSAIELLGAKRFAPLFGTQFLGAFNDNLFRAALVTLVTFRLQGWSSEEVALLNNIAPGLFILPYFLFGAISGQLADKYEKARLIRLVKMIEIGVMAIAAVGFWLQSVPVLLVTLFLMGTQSTLFGPLKYSILPQHLSEGELMAGNGLVEGATFIAILIGTMIGALLPPDWVIPGIMGAAVLGYLCSCSIPIAEGDSALPIGLNPIRETRRILGMTRASRTLYQSILGISWFWAFGLIVLAQIPFITKEVIGGDEIVQALLLALFSLGVGVGSVLSARMSGPRIEPGLVPLGSLGLSLFTLDAWLQLDGFVVGVAADGAMAFALGPGLRFAVDLVLIGASGGLFTVPLYAMIQSRADPEQRSRIIAANNIINTIFMIAATTMAVGLLSLGYTPVDLFWVVAVLNVVAAIYIYSLVPEFLLRLIVLCLVRVMYRTRAEGQQHLPDRGAAVLVCNHVSFVDALILLGLCNRPLRFVIDHRIYATPLLNYLFRAAKAIPIAPAHEDEALLQQALHQVARALERDELVCIFPEGEITRSGQLNRFRKGVEEIVQRTPVPVIPAGLDGLWGSLFSRQRGSAMPGLPRRLRARVRLNIGAPLIPTEVDAALLQERVAELCGQSVAEGN